MSETSFTCGRVVTNIDSVSSREGETLLLYTCSSCAGRIISFESVSTQKCPNCGAEASAEAGLRISIPLGMEEFLDHGLEARAMRDDLVQLSTPSTFVDS